MKTVNYVLIMATAFLTFTSCRISGEQFNQGQKLYGVHCESCHMADGTGLGSNIPPLAASDYLRERQPDIACIIRDGLTDSIIVNGILYTENMAGVPQLSEFEMANIINYINQAWGNDFGFVTVKSLRESLSDCP